MKTGDVDFQILTCAICLHKERGAGIEPAIRGFADLRLPIWLSPRFQFHSIILCPSSASRFLLSFRSGLLVYFPLRAPHFLMSPAGFEPASSSFGNWRSCSAELRAR